MKTIEALRLINKREDVLEGKCSSAVSHNPDYYKSLRELKMIRFIKSLLMFKYAEDDDEMVQDDKEYIEMLFGGKNKIIIEIKEGDNVLEYMQSHPTIKYEKIKKYLEENGLVLKGSIVSK